MALTCAGAIVAPAIFVDKILRGHTRADGVCTSTSQDDRM